MIWSIKGLFVSRVEIKCCMPVVVNVMVGILDTGFCKVIIECITDRSSLVTKYWFEMVS